MMPEYIERIDGSGLANELSPISDALKAQGKRLQMLMGDFVSAPTSNLKDEIDLNMETFMSLTASRKSERELKKKKETTAEAEMMASMEHALNASVDEAETSAMQQQQSIISAVPGNAVCADCSTPNPQCVSISLGVAVCVECSRVHRSLGINISKVATWTVDILDSPSMEVVRGIGNAMMNRTLEAGLEAGMKPGPRADAKKKETYIKAKYTEGVFLPTEKIGEELDKALLAAAASGDVAAVVTAIAMGAEPQTSLNMGQTALHEAAQNGHLLVARVLINDGRLDYKQVNWELKTPRQLATEANHHDLARMLDEAEVAAATAYAEKMLAHEAAAEVAAAAKQETKEEGTERLGFRARMGAFARAVTPTRWQNRRGSNENAAIPSRSGVAPRSTAGLRLPPGRSSGDPTKSTIDTNPNRWALEDMDDEL